MALLDDEDLPLRQIVTAGLPRPSSARPVPAGCHDLPRGHIALLDDEDLPLRQIVTAGVVGPRRTPGPYHAGMASPADATATAVGFCRTLRRAGVPVTPGRARRFVEALDVLDARRREDVYWAGRVTLCTAPDDLSRYDAGFAAYWSGEAPHRRRKPDLPARTVLRTVAHERPDDTGDDGDDGDPLQLQAGASAREVLRRRDLATLEPADRALLAELLRAFDLPGEARRGRRPAASPRGRIDRRATVRAALRGLGDPSTLRRVRARPRPRRVVLLLDVSGSMSAYADALLRFAHVAAHRRARRAVPTEVFTVGTRLTRVTRELGHRDPDSAMAAVAGAIADWSGGTRLGEGLKAFLDGWGQRGMARGAVVVVLSDGWERGGVELLAAQMARLHRLAHRVVWANPRKAQPGYAPLAAGMAAALPFVDDFVEGHSVEALERLAEVVAGRA